MKLQQIQISNEDVPDNCKLCSKNRGRQKMPYDITAITDASDKNDPADPGKIVKGKVYIYPRLKAKSSM